MIEKTLKVTLWSTHFAIWPVASSLVLAICLCGSHPYLAQMTGFSVSQPAIINNSPFATPQDAANRLVHAVNDRCWRDEYECYTAAQQARFAYHVMVCTHELSDSQELSVELAHILQKFQFPSELLDRFPSQRLDLKDISDPKEAQRKIQDYEDTRRSRLKLWEGEVQSLSIDWDRLIEQLQTLLFENFRHHINDGHPSQTGIVHHLDYHVFESVSDIEVDGTRAEGAIIAIVRDPEFFQENGLRRPQAGMAISNTLYHMFQRIAFVDRRVKRSPARIEFVREGDKWKVASVPFR